VNLPRPRLPRLYSMAVGAADDALVALDLRLDGGDGLERRNVGRLSCHVVNIESHWVRIESAVDAPRGGLEVRDPRLHGACAGIRRGVHAFSVPLPTEPPLAPRSSLVCTRLGPRRSGSVTACSGAVFRRCPLRHERRSALHTVALGSERTFPRRHGPMIAADDLYPCKPEIFTQTYDPVGGGSDG